jgi:hypothetical protein
MGLKQWLVRHTRKPSDYAQAYTSGLVQWIEHLTASLVSFSGRRETVAKESKFAFVNFYEMEQAGFYPLSKDISILIAPNIEEIKAIADNDLLCNVFQATTAFLYLYSTNAAFKYMKAENATLFSSALLKYVAESNKSRFGFGLHPRQVAIVMNDLIPLFHCEQILNINLFGNNDGVGLLINHLSLSKDGSIQYGFVIGSQKQKLGYASFMLETISEIDNYLMRATQDFHW